MADTEYIEALAKHLATWAGLAEKRAQLDAELAKLRQLIHATLNMLSDEERRKYSVAFESMGAPQLGLTDAICRILETATDWMTAVEVRDELVNSGFNFDSYTSNPLASVHTVLKRLFPEKLEPRERGQTGSVEYRWKARKKASEALRRLGKIEQSYGAPRSLANTPDWMLKSLGGKEKE